MVHTNPDQGLHCFLCTSSVQSPVNKGNNQLTVVNFSRLNSLTNICHREALKKVVFSYHYLSQGNTYVGQLKSYTITTFALYWQGLRQSLILSPDQKQLQDQLRRKHAELQQQILRQQEELRQVNEQLIMAQYGSLRLEPVYKVNYD